MCEGWCVRGEMCEEGGVRGEVYEGEVCEGKECEG